MSCGDLVDTDGTAEEGFGDLAADDSPCDACESVEETVDPISSEASCAAPCPPYFEHRPRGHKIATLFLTGFSSFFRALGIDVVKP